MKKRAATARDTMNAAGKRRAFTLLELLIVLILIVILASLTVPRLLHTEKRKFGLFVDRVGDMLTMYAQRENLSRRPVGLRINEQANTLEMVYLDRNEDTADRPPMWRVDRFVDPINLPPDNIVAALEVRADGQWLDIASFPLVNDPARQRPRIEIHIRDDEQREAVWTLAPHAVTPYRRSDRQYGLPPMTAIDLDAEGRSREEW